MALGVRVPIFSELNSKGFKQAYAEFKKLEGASAKAGFLMKKALSPVGITAIAGAASTAAYAMVDMAKAAAEDARQQTTLATTLRNVMNATDGQIASIEKLISSMQMAYGVSDSELRVGFANLTRATNDLTQAQKLLQLAVDISAATGKDLEGVTIALSKAAQGQFTSLKRLGVPLDENLLRTKDLASLTDYLASIYGGSATENAKTLSGQMDILNEKYNESKEKLGQDLMPVMTDFVNLFSNVIDVFNTLDNAAAAVNDDFNEFGDSILELVSVLPGLGNVWNPVVEVSENSEDAAINAAAAFGRLKTELLGVWDAINYGKEPLNWMTQIGLPNLNSHLESLGYDTVIRSGNSFGASLQEQETDLERFTNAVRDAQNQLSMMVTGYLDLSAAAKTGSIRGFVGSVTGQAAQIKNLAKNLGTLSGRGLAPQAIQGIMSLDLGTAASLAQDLVNSAFSTRYIRQLNTAYQGIASTATSFGQTFGANFMTGGAAPVTQNITITNPNPKAVVNAIREYGRNAGPIPIAVTGSF
jgi:hypothetical protein